MLGTSDTPDAEQRVEGRTSAGKRRARLAAGIVAGSLLAVLLAIVLFALSNRTSLPEITPTMLDDAARQWDKYGPPNYDLTVRVTGSQTGEYKVSVRNDDVVSLQTGAGRRPPERTWYSWTVPGLFDVIYDDLELSQRMKREAADPATSGLVQRGEFDEEFGYPRLYRRVILGTTVSTQWQVTSFESVKGKLARVTPKMISKAENDEKK